MFHSFAVAHSNRNRRNRAGLSLGLFFGLVSAVLVFVAAAHAQPVEPPTTSAYLPAALRPPAGARVAIVEFYDLECPACAAANPALMEAVAKYHIPWIRYDLLIPTHNWSRGAAVYARWFDIRSKTLGGDYRDAVFANQPSIETPAQLTQFTEKFARSHDIALPFEVDPQGRLLAEVQADVDLGKSLGINMTPTIIIVMTDPKGAPFIVVRDPERDLFRDIDQAMAETRP